MATANTEPKINVEAVLDHVIEANLRTALSTTQNARALADLHLGDDARVEQLDAAIEALREAGARP